MQQLTPIIKGSVYHIYNRGINSCDIFNEKKNYQYFIERWIKYVSATVDTYAYCLMKNHFHVLVRIKPEDVYAELEDGGKYLLNASRQFSHAFNSYTQGFNKEY